MFGTRILVTENSFATEFARCCKEYETLKIAVAWCGNPNRILPYKHLKEFDGAISIVAGVAFEHTHPDAIEWFSDIGADIRVFKGDQSLFHPKIYLFSKQKRYALFFGSSNLTYGGFYSNIEANLLIEGVSSLDIESLENEFSKWHSSGLSFKPTKQWLNAYRLRYIATAQKNKERKILTPPNAEDEISSVSWLQHADWDIYYQEVAEGLQKRVQNGWQYNDYHTVLDAADREISIPWTAQYFKDIEKRRIIGGMEPYGSLGHVAASGHVRHLLANGTAREQSKMASAINSIARLNSPVQWTQLKRHLDELVSLGPTMKVWSRALTLVRPDLYCTVASSSVRSNLCHALGIPQKGLDEPAGYIKLIQLIHSSPWFASAKPYEEIQANIWKRRAAFLDAIFY